MRRLILASLVATCLSAAITVQSADALVNAVAEGSCSAGGFTGYVSVHYYYDPASTRATVGYFGYRINKGANRGGNNADVQVTDYAFLPVKSWYLGTGIQDNVRHLLANPTDYSRQRYGASSSFGFGFTFDKSYADDPSCGGSIPRL